MNTSLWIVISVVPWGLFVWSFYESVRRELSLRKSWVELGSKLKTDLLIQRDRADRLDELLEKTIKAQSGCPICDCPVARLMDDLGRKQDEERRANDTGTILTMIKGDGKGLM